MTDEDRRDVIAGALAASAITYFEMFISAQQVRENLVAAWERVGSPAGAFADAVGSAAQVGQLIDDDADTAARREHLMTVLRCATTNEQLAASLAALELLERERGCDCKGERNCHNRRMNTALVSPNHALL